MSCHICPALEQALVGSSGQDKRRARRLHSVATGSRLRGAKQKLLPLCDGVPATVAPEHVTLAIQKCRTHGESTPR